MKNMLKTMNLQGELQIGLNMQANLDIELETENNIILTRMYLDYW